MPRFSWIKVSGAVPALGLHLVLGKDWAAMAKNSLRNLEQGRTGLVQGLAIRIDPNR